MSDYSAQSLRDKMKAKAHRMAGGGDAKKVDASSYTPPESLKAGVQTGMRPVSRQARKDGGKVGEEIENRNAKIANESRDGEKHDGGMKKGGAVDKKELKHDKGCKCAACGGRAERASGGKVGKTNINIVINTDRKQEPGGVVPPRPPMVPPMGAVPPGAPPMGAGPSGPPPMPGLMRPQGAPMAPPQGLGAIAPGLPGRKDGGKVNADLKMQHGAGGGLGRLEKIKKYGDNA